jgi:hypothetical protein
MRRQRTGEVGCRAEARRVQSMVKMKPAGSPRAVEVSRYSLRQQVSLQPVRASSPATGRRPAIADDGGPQSAYSGEVRVSEIPAFRRPTTGQNQLPGRAMACRLHKMVLSALARIPLSILKTKSSRNMRPLRS